MFYSLGNQINTMVQWDSIQESFIFGPTIRQSNSARNGTRLDKMQTLVVIKVSESICWGLFPQYLTNHHKCHLFGKGYLLPWTDYWYPWGCKHRLEQNLDKKIHPVADVGFWEVFFFRNPWKNGFPPEACQPKKVNFKKSI